MGGEGPRAPREVPWWNWLGTGSRELSGAAVFWDSLLSFGLWVFSKIKEYLNAEFGGWKVLL